MADEHNGLSKKYKVVFGSANQFLNALTNADTLGIVYTGHTSYHVDASSKAMTYGIAINNNLVTSQDAIGALNKGGSHHLGFLMMIACGGLNLGWEGLVATNGEFTSSKNEINFGVAEDKAGNPFLIQAMEDKSAKQVKLTWDDLGLQTIPGTEK